MKLLQTAALAACLTAGSVAAHADMIELDDTQLDRVSAGFLDLSFGDIGSLLPGGFEIPEIGIPSLPNAPGLPSNGIPGAPEFPGLPFDGFPGLPGAK